MKYWIFLLLVIAQQFQTDIAYSEVEKDLGMIRLSRDGAGPSHMFWLNGPPTGQGGNDVIAVIDPLFAAIRFFTVSRDNNQTLSLNKRILGAGVCALPADFRPWRIHQLKTEVHIESMPETKNENPNNANRADFETKLYVVKRDLVSETNRENLQSTGSLVETTSWLPSSDGVLKCGVIMPLGKVGRTAPYTASRGKNNPQRTIIITNNDTALSSAATLVVRAMIGSKFRLFSARELEPAGGHRIVQITEGAESNDGMLRLFPKLLAFNSRGQIISEYKFKDTSVRSKLGDRALAVMPGGELLAMGKSGQDFRIQSCGILFAGSARSVSGLCSTPPVGDDIRSRQISDSSPQPPEAEINQNQTTTITKRLSAADIFSNVREFSTPSWSVEIPESFTECRNVDGCTVTGESKPFVALKGIRLAKKEYSQVGAPYAQTETLEPVYRFLDRWRVDRGKTLKGEFTEALRTVTTGSRGQPGNLKDGYLRDMGIDCSALVQIAWNGVDQPPRSTRRIDTAEIQFQEKSFICKNRLPHVGYLRSGDAIGLRIKDGPQHVVLYASPIKFDKASEYWFVLESASSCDGVCWTAYDPSFFNGWGLYRAENRTDLKCPPPLKQTKILGNPIPASLSAWETRVLTDPEPIARAPSP